MRAYSKTEIARGFTEWENQQRLDMSQFASEEFLRGKTPEEIGNACANALIDFIENTKPPDTLLKVVIPKSSEP